MVFPAQLPTVLNEGPLTTLPLLKSSFNNVSIAPTGRSVIKASKMTNSFVFMRPVLHKKRKGIINTIKVIIQFANKLQDC